MALADPIFWLLLSQGLACIAIAMVPGIPGSRRTLSIAFVVAIPIAGPLLAAMASRARGSGSERADPDLGLDIEKPPVHPARARRLSDRIPTVELLAADPDRRREALAELARSSDPTAVDALRFGVEHGEPDLVLEAAMTLDELIRSLDERRAELRRKVARSPSYETALEAADAAAQPIYSGLADAALHRSLAAEARSFYSLASSLAPQRSAEVKRRLARLEIAVRRPGEALAALEGDPSEAAAELRAEAAFAARRFDLIPSRSRAA